MFNLAAPAGDGNAATVDRIKTTKFGLGAADNIFGGADSDIALGGTGADLIAGDNTETGATPEAGGLQSGGDILIGDQGTISLFQAGVSRRLGLCRQQCDRDRDHRHRRYRRRDRHDRGQRRQRHHPRRRARRHLDGRRRDAGCAGGRGQRRRHHPRRRRPPCIQSRRSAGYCRRRGHGRRQTSNARSDRDDQRRGSVQRIASTATTAATLRSAERVATRCSAISTTIPGPLCSPRPIPDRTCCSATTGGSASKAGRWH